MQIISLSTNNNWTLVQLDWRYPDVIDASALKRAGLKFRVMIGIALVKFHGLPQSAQGPDQAPAG